MTKVRHISLAFLSFLRMFWILVQDEMEAKCEGREQICRPKAEALLPPFARSLARAPSCTRTAFPAYADVKGRSGVRPLTPLQENTVTNDINTRVTQVNTAVTVLNTAIMLVSIGLSLYALRAARKASEPFVDAALSPSTTTRVGRARRSRRLERARPSRQVLNSRTR
ncbi:hypothetical protein [Alicyclobacillus acidocaldarius]|uniref:Uncharacterized protein n=1 Tax=Alicyclobacillus acidocaldarius (strain Tc-4-1) TaxID=1048834 RepID=F8IJR1_ALIAT|nr:hypothetical protein [Alicyclobacillus acidocaldarius]AEJ42250.1 hypothetical protein TC41_0278 [Alicyclobacillus acidocaldarius subsp. acidocaldarius Tc-4-1]